MEGKSTATSLSGKGLAALHGNVNMSTVRFVVDSII